MPTYDYVCGACGHALEIFHSITETPKKKCPKCGKPKLERQIGAGAGILFKGGGFYQTDYRSDAYKQAQKADSSAPAPSTTNANDPTSAPSAASADAKPKKAEAKRGKPKKSA